MFPANPIQLQVVNILQQNQEKVTALHKYAAYVLENTPRTLEDFRFCYKVRKDETEIFSLFRNLHQHSLFFTQTLEPRLMKVAGNLEGYTLAVKEKYEVMISALSDQNLKEQLESIPEVMGILFNDLIVEATQHFSNAREIEEMIIQCHEFNLQDLTALQLRLLQTEQEHTRSTSLVDSLKTKMKELEELQEKVRKDYDYYYGVCFQAVQSVRYKVTAIADEGAKKNDSDEEGEVMKSAKQQVLQTAPGKNFDHLIGVYNLTHTIYHSASLYQARKKRDALIQSIQTEGRALSGEERILAQLFVLKADLIEISELLQESCLGIEFLRSSWNHIILDLHRAIEQSTGDQNREQLIQLRVNLLVAKQMWINLQQSVVKFRETAFLRELK